jgi:hypothetical protein
MTEQMLEQPDSFLTPVTRIHPEYNGEQSSGRHEGEFRQAGWVEVDGAVASELVPLPVGQHEHRPAGPTVKQRLGEMLVRLLEAPRVKSFR